jgi:hypothetical protein
MLKKVRYTNKQTNDQNVNHWEARNGYFHNIKLQITEKQIKEVLQNTCINTLCNILLFSLEKEIVFDEAYIQPIVDELVNLDWTVQQARGYVYDLICCFNRNLLMKALTNKIKNDEDSNPYYDIVIDLGNGKSLIIKK